MAQEILGRGSSSSHDITTVLCHGSVMSRVQVTSQCDITAMAGAPCPPLHWEQQRAADIIRLLSLYRPLLDAYIIDFFAEGLWAKLPPAWQAALEVADPPQLATMLLGTGATVGPGTVWPLSLLAFVAAAHALSFPRGQLGGAPCPPCQSPHLHPLLRRHVKPKKQHEIRRLGKVLQRLSQATGCDRVVDVGAGQGHFSRFLAFSLGLSVTAVEGDSRLVSLAERFDQELLRELKKAQARSDTRRLPPSQHHPNTAPERTDPASLCPRCPQHVAGWLDPQVPGQEFLLAPTPGPALAARNPLAMSTDSERILLTGLHACGDLSVALLRHFARSPQVAAVTSAACCYMKLSTCPEPTGSSLPGYPLSTWVAGLPGHTLSYRAREAACHAVEEYTERLGRDSECLRVHCYRAVLETLIRAADPSKKHLGVQTVKKAHTLSFPECVWGMLGWGCHLWGWIQPPCLWIQSQCAPCCVSSTRWLPSSAWCCCWPHWWRPSSCSIACFTCESKVSSAPLCPSSTPGSPHATWCWWPHGYHWMQCCQAWTRTVVRMKTR
ncbi:protein RRNAD1 isoform X5 [Numida meleagris]|uniref:protein RRNAD1 isoform X5 n=1 Tax=Numida meleagris TaxID=8996 RepID=UPI000B3E2795|nr:protein RRNAD1 isoform X5 [Numida meleagris]